MKEPAGEQRGNGENLIVSDVQGRPAFTHMLGWLVRPEPCTGISVAGRARRRPSAVDCT